MHARRKLLSLSLCVLLSGVIESASHGWSDATTSAMALQGKFVIRGISGNGIHTHGGPPAQVGHVRFTFENHTDRPHRVSITDIEFLEGIKDCDHPPQKVTSHPKSAGILLDDGKQRESAPQVEVKAGATVNGTVGFPSVPAYYVYCDRFAFRVHFKIDNEKVAVIDEVNIMREEPLRDGE